MDRRLKLVEGQLRPGGVNDPNVLKAFLDVPREAFVDGGSLSLIYSDRAARARSGGGLTLPPLSLGRLIEALNLLAGETVLDVAGCGYSAALLAAMGGKVTAIAADEAAMNRLPVEAFDAILVNGSFAVDPEPLLKALAPSGRLAGFRFRESGARAVRIDRGASGSWDERVLFEGSAPGIAAFARPPQFAL